MLQLWFIRSFRQLIHKEWLQVAVMAQAIPAINIQDYAVNPSKFEQVQFKPRGWSWIDPTSEVESYEKAIQCGFTTVTQVIAQTADGRDLEDVLKERKRELEMMESMGLMFTTDPETLNQPAQQATSGPNSDTADSVVEEAEKMLREQSRGRVSHG